MLRRHEFLPRHTSTSEQPCNNSTSSSVEPETHQPNEASQSSLNLNQHTNSQNSSASTSESIVSHSSTNSIAASISAHSNSFQQTDQSSNPPPTSTIQINQSNLMGLFPCLHPINRHMGSREMRIQTFLDHSSTWPAHRIRATPVDIADAGMYYLGERDRVKCWYCNGGLQNWERDDSPWKEHAKWFPLCEFVLQQKGPQFIYRIVTEHPSLRRPMLYNPSTSSSAREIAVIVNQSQSNHHEFRNESQTSHPVVVDPQDEMRKRRQNVDQTMTSSPLVSDARLIGFDDDIIRMAVTRLVVFMQNHCFIFSKFLLTQLCLHFSKYETNDQSFTNLHDLVETILSIKENEEESVNGDELLSIRNFQSSSSIFTPQDEMQRLEELKRCRVCCKDDARMVLIPCGHLCCCVNCGNKIKKCPICKESIRERIRSYIS